MAPTYPVRLADQMREHLRSLRKKRGLTQAQVGAGLGVSQARIAEIEASPGLVNFDQMVQLLAHLGANLCLEVEEQNADVAPPAASVSAAQMRARYPQSDVPASPAHDHVLHKKKGSW